MRSVLAALVPAVMRHLQAYAEVAGDDVHDAAVVLARRLLRLLIAAAATFIALLMLCAWLLALAWDGPWRAWTAAGLALGFAAAAAALALPLLRRRAPPRALFFPRVRDELCRDRELIERALDGKGRAANGGEHAPG